MLSSPPTGYWLVAYEGGGVAPFCSLLPPLRQTTGPFLPLFPLRTSKFTYFVSSGTMLTPCCLLPSPSLTPLPSHSTKLTIPITTTPLFSLLFPRFSYLFISSLLVCLVTLLVTHLPCLLFNYIIKKGN